MVFSRPSKLNVDVKPLDLIGIKRRYQRDVLNTAFQSNYLLSQKAFMTLWSPSKLSFYRPSVDYPPHHLSRHITSALGIYSSRKGMRYLKIMRRCRCINFFGTFFRDNVLHH